MDRKSLRWVLCKLYSTVTIFLLQYTIYLQVRSGTPDKHSKGPTETFMNVNFYTSSGNNSESKKSTIVDSNKALHRHILRCFQTARRKIRSAKVSNKFVSNFERKTARNNLIQSSLQGLTFSPHEQCNKFNRTP